MVSNVLDDWNAADEEVGRRPECRRGRMPVGSGASSRFTRRRPKSPKQTSGIHRRRRKKIQW